MNKLFILLLFSENVEPQLTGSTTTSPRYSPLEKDAIKMKSMLTIVFYLKKMCTPEFHGSYESNEVEDAVCKTESKANFLSISRQSNNLVTSTLNLYRHCSHKPISVAGDTLNPWGTEGLPIIFGASWIIGAEGVCS